MAELRWWHLSRQARQRLTDLASREPGTFQIFRQFRTYRASKKQRQLQEPAPRSLAQSDTETKGPDTATWVLRHPVPEEPIPRGPSALGLPVGGPWGQVTQKDSGLIGTREALETVTTAAWGWPSRSSSSRACRVLCQEDHRALCQTELICT